MTKSNKEFIEFIKRVLKEARAKDYEISTAMLDFSAGGNGSASVFYMNPECVEYHINENFKNTKEPWKEAFLAMFIFDFESCVKSLFEQTFYDKKYEYNLNEERDEKIHKIINKCYNDLADIIS